LKNLTFDKGPNLVFLSETEKQDFKLQVLRYFNGYSNLIVVRCIGDGLDAIGGLHLKK